MLKISQTCLANVSMGRDDARPQPMSAHANEPRGAATSAVLVPEESPSLSVPVPTAVVGTMGDG
jgi:hypothetical protein